MMSYELFSSRRKFIKNTFYVTLGASACRKSRFVTDYDGSEDIFSFDFKTRLKLFDKEKIVFIGDSITDALRDRTVETANNAKGLGSGYVAAIERELVQNEQYKNCLVLNRGISGNVTDDLINRWNTDAIDLKPDILNILIGVNDLRRGKDPNLYYHAYKSIIEKTVMLLPDTKIVLCEPFILPNIQDYNSLKFNFHEYRKVVRSLVREYKTYFVPFYDAFEKESNTLPLTSLLEDGFHPAVAGVNILAQKWIELVS